MRAFGVDRARRFIFHRLAPVVGQPTRGFGASSFNSFLFALALAEEHGAFFCLSREERFENREVVCFKNTTSVELPIRTK